MQKRTRKLQFSAGERKKIIARDNGKCIFCENGYFTKCGSDFLLSIKETMHFVPRSAGGVGVEQNGAIGCKYHHEMLDNGSSGRRREMLDFFEKYLRGKYPGWNREALIYKKYNF